MNAVTHSFSCAVAAILLALSAPLASAADLPRVQLQTSLGSIEIELEQTRAPGTVENFLAYVDDGFYDGTLFHRVIEGFMVQGGGFDESYTRKVTNAPIRNEADNGLSNRPYTVAMARTNEPHSATAQFFINTEENTNLDFTSASPRGWGYAVFGRVVDGFDVVDRISESPTGRNGPFSRDAPKEAILIERVTRLLPATPETAPEDTDAPAAVSSGTDVN